MTTSPSEVVPSPPSPAAVVAARNLAFGALEEFADLAASLWRSVAEAAFRGDRLTVDVHCRQIAAVTREAFATAKTLDAAGGKVSAV